MNLRTAALAIFALCPSLLGQGGPGDGGSQGPFAGLRQKIDAVKATFTSNTIPMTGNEAQALAHQLSQKSGANLILDDLRTDQEKIVYFDPNDRSVILSIDVRSRGFLFNAGMNGMRGESETPNLPNDQIVAQRMAREHLRDLQLLPPREQMLLDHFGGLNMAVRREDGSTADYKKLITVRYGRTLGDLRVLGPGGRIIVQLGQNGRLRGLIWQWESFDRHAVQNADKIPTDRIAKLIELRMLDITPLAIHSRIESADVVYYDDGVGIMEPSIRIVAQLTFNDPRGGTFQNPFDFYVPILRKTTALFPHIEDEGVTRPNRE